MEKKQQKQNNEQSEVSSPKTIPPSKKEAVDGPSLSELQNDVNSMLKKKEGNALPSSAEPKKNTEQPAPQKKTPQSVADALFIQKDITYPGVKDPVTPKKETVTPTTQEEVSEPETPQKEASETAPQTPPKAGEPTLVPDVDTTDQTPDTSTPQHTQTTGVVSGTLLTDDMPDTQKPISSIRTLHSDIANSVKTQQTSLASIAVAESEKRARTGAPLTPTKPTNKKKYFRFALIGFGALLLLGGIGALIAVVAFQFGGGTVTPQGEQPLIFVNESVSVPLPETRFGTIDTLNTTKKTEVGLSLGHIERFNLTSVGTTTPLSLDSFISRLVTNIPSGLLRVLTGRYVLGIHSLAENEFVFLIEVEDQDAGFANMLKWEKDIAGDLPFLLRETTQATRTASTSADVFTNKTTFRDRVIENRDVRVLLDANGDIRLGYSFPRPDILILANNENSFIELFGRLSGVRFNE